MQAAHGWHCVDNGGVSTSLNTSFGYGLRMTTQEERDMALKVGLFVGREWSWPPKFIDEVNGRDQGVTAEYVKIGGTQMNEPSDYAVIIDRISHEVPYYRSYLKNAVLQGVTVVNNPFMWTADDKFFEASLATKLGVASPKTAVLPNKDYVPGIVPTESLRNLTYPMDWQAIIDYVGLPCVLKDAHGGGWRDVYVCHSVEELIYRYDQAGLLTMIVQEFIEWDHYVRCLCIGQEDILPIAYDPKERKYHVRHDHLTPELGQRIVEDSRTLMRALGYDMNSCEWAIRDGVPYALDFMNPAPDMDIYSLTPHYFEWAVNTMADMAIRLSKHPRPQLRELRWNEMFGAAEHPAAPKPAASTASSPSAGSTNAELAMGVDDPTTAASLAARTPAGSRSGQQVPAPSDEDAALSSAKSVTP